MDPRHNRIDYLELGAKNAGDYAKTKAFFETAFGWTYQDYGPDYCDTKSSGVGSGINGDSDHRTLQPFAGDLRRGSRSGPGQGGRGRRYRDARHLQLPRRAPLPLRRSVRQRARRLVREVATLESSRARGRHSAFK